MQDFKDQLWDYCNGLAKVNNALVGRMRREIEFLSREIKDLDSFDAQIAAFKGYELKFDLMSRELEVREDILYGLRRMFDLDTEVAT